MHIIIPMSGIGKRFMDAGYKVPKPLIKVDDKTIIEHVCNLFPDENKFTFICNSRHLADTNIKKVLQSIKPNSNIIGIPAHNKGPVYKFLKAHKR
jgi:NDP-sugar pyrophosphorylase family protein